MPRLQLLDLSLNNIRVIREGTFSGLNLQYLFLGNNPSIIIPDTAFRGLSSRVLGLQNTGLTELRPAMLHPLGQSLEKLFVNGNNIRRFDPAMAAIFDQLESLRIYENPLTCDCEARWLRQYYEENRDKMREADVGSMQEPRCESPRPVAGEFFSRIALTDFLCERPTLHAAVSFSQGRASLLCKSTGKPTPKIIWHRPNGIIEESEPLSNMDENQAELQVLSTEPSIYGQYRCEAINEAGNTTLSVNMSWPFAFSQPCPQPQPVTSKDVVITNPVTPQPETNMFKIKYFTLVDLICAVFGTFIGTLVVCVIVLHFCVYRKKKVPSQYSTPPMSEYSNSSIKNIGYPATSTAAPQTLPSQHMMQNRPLPVKPMTLAGHQNPGRIYDENHYMSTQLDENCEFIHLGQHNGGLMSPCEACRTINSHNLS